MKIDERDGDLWLTQKSIGELFNTTRNNVTMHINDIYNSYELEQNSTSKKFLLVQSEGNGCFLYRLYKSDFDLLIEETNK